MLDDYSQWFKDPKEAAVRAARIRRMRARREAERPKRIVLKRVGKDVMVWNLGLGPCGRTVVDLRVTQDANGVVIYQTCDDHPVPDRFFYAAHTVEAMAVYTTNTPEVACKAPNQG